MGRLNVLALRTVLAVVFAVILSRMFYPDKPVVYVAGLAVFLVMMAYFFEYIRKNKQK